MSNKSPRIIYINARHLVLLSSGGDTLTPLNVGRLLLRTKVTSGQQVERVFLLVHGTVGEEESNTGDERDDGDTAVVPGDVGVSSKRSESLGESGGESSCEELDGLHKRPHVLGRLGESVLEGGDRSENFGNGNEDVDTGNGPDGDVSLVVGVVGLVVARGLVDVVLENGGPDHGEGSENETSSDLLDGGEADSTLAEEGVDDGIHDWHLRSS